MGKGSSGVYASRPDREEKKSIKEQISESIFEDITTGIYPPGTVLNEGTLMEKYGASKSPVREALVELCNEGVLTNIPRFGYQVVPITPGQFRDMQELRLIIEESALRRTVPFITDDQLAELEENVRAGAYLAEEKDVLKHWRHNMSFHLLLCKQCQNLYLYKTLVGILRFFSRGALQYYTNSWEKSKRTDTTSHERILEALRARDTETAVALLRKDIACMEEEIIRP
ncbi:GntR family transcriptional regulator [Allofournierella sp.]|uniref:GntR family transcriptional regulator n=1 Tax=Allofournierella sp. TaxID=1940256 RepID=UPI003AB8BB2D